MNIRGTASIYLILASIQLAACSSGAPDPGQKAEQVSAAGLGAACVPEREADPSFRSFSASEIGIETNHPSCETGICLQNMFQGRTTCPYGGDDCLTPSGEPVAVPVAPQFVARPPSDSVYCSCRCDGPASSGPYCACPDDFECRHLISDFGAPGGEDLVGSYCVKRGTHVEDPGMLLSGPVCDPALASCEDR